MQIPHHQRAPHKRPPHKRLNGRHRLVAVAVSIAMVLSACSSSPEEQAAASNAQDSIAGLETSSDVRDFEVLNVADGSATTLREVVDGDRPVLLWFFAPH